MKAADRAVVRERLSSQWISRSPATSARDVVQWMTAMQGQDLASVLWSIGVRWPGSIAADIERAFSAGAIVRSWPMRGTLHVVVAEDLPWMLGLTSARMLQRSAARGRALGITDRHLGAARDAASGALGGGLGLGREDLYRAFESVGIDTTGQRGYHLLWNLAQNAVICLGPWVNGRQAFVLVDEWIGTGRALDRDEALAEFALRYFSSHGPATIRDFAWWSSLTLADARAGTAIAAGDLERRTDGDDEYFLAPDRAEARRDRVRLLPGFDEFLLGYQTRSPQLAPHHAGRVVPGGNGVFLSTIVDDGNVVGTWTRTTSAGRVSLATQRFSPGSSRLDDGITRAGGEFARFLGLTLARRA